MHHSILILPTFIHSLKVYIPYIIIWQKWLFFPMTISPSSHFGEIFLFLLGSVLPCSCRRLGLLLQRREKEALASTLLDHLPSSYLHPIVKSETGVSLIFRHHDLTPLDETLIKLVLAGCPLQGSALTHPQPLLISSIGIWLLRPNTLSLQFSTF